MEKWKNRKSEQGTMSASEMVRDGKGGRYAISIQRMWVMESFETIRLKNNE